MTKLEQKKCFIIQPLTDKYKCRCDETYKPAIKKAGLSPYRVDENYDAIKLKIQAIKEEIKKSAVCLAEITEDNPNVWYELGLADGFDIPVVLICEKSKREKLPFDVNQRDTYFYNTGSQGDWKKLEKEITKRLRSTVEKEPAKKAKEPIVKSAANDESEFGKAELFILKALYYRAADNSSWKIKSVLQKNMQQSGFSSEDMTDAFTRLRDEDIIGRLYRGLGGSTLYSLTKNGRQWCLKNKELLREIEK